MSNPTSGADKADSSGRFPQIFAAEGAVFDILLKDSLGNTVASYLSVVSLGSNTGTLSRDFTTSRFQARGAGGFTYIEAGDPTGDDVGGKMSLGGWNGTQADEIDINGALVNVVGRLKEGGYKIDGVVRQENQTFSAAASIIIPLTDDPAGVRLFQIDIGDLVLISNASQNVQVAFSYDGGATYSAGTYQCTVSSSHGTSQSNSGGTTSNFIVVAAVGGASAPNFAGSIRMTVQTPVSGNNMTVVKGQAAMWSFAADGPLNSVFTLVGPAASGRATHMKITSTTGGTMSGNFRVRPLRGLGET